MESSELSLQEKRPLTDYSCLSKAITTSTPRIQVSFHPSKDIAHRTKITCSRDAYEVAKQIWDEDVLQLYEEFKVLYLDRKNGVIGYRNLTKGSATQTTVNVPLLFAIALQCSACSIILLHNHPSDNPLPSENDKELTKGIKQGAACLNIKLLDHLIMTSSGYYSFSDDGLN